MKKILIIIICIAVFVGGWALYAFRVMPAVEDVIDEFHRNFNSRNFKNTYTNVCSKEFQEALPYQAFNNYMNELYDTVGSIKETKKGKWGIFYKNVGLTFNVEYHNETEKGEMKEYFTLLKQDPGWKIFMYDPKVKIDKE